MHAIMTAYIVMSAMVLAFPIQSFGESLTMEETVSLNNQTFTVIVNPPTNEIIINSNTSDIEHRLAIIENMQETNQGYNSGHLLIVSATILSFLGFGSFLFIPKTRGLKLPSLTMIVLICVLVIILTHLFVMHKIISNEFLLDDYINTVIITAILMIVIIISMILINFLISKVEKPHQETDSFYSEIQEDLVRQKSVRPQT